MLCDKMMVKIFVSVYNFSKQSGSKVLTSLKNVQVFISEDMNTQ